ncbi:DUF4291 domain-containing protein [Microscilla marina]|uniref:DUF4291 domain-containing protein n=1 Tax=Microscilla marina ATCC 23134 TaxID=313606 RepID=A1ZDM3_MICM2|nr:DUF4291 domain-containing protein [Microscilla marina]EAY31762.1 hypothetical protein M23134_05268 [Microscilla marina ATCC 23134]
MKQKNKYEIRALYTPKHIALYAAFSSSIANVALKSQQLLPPFSYDRMTWVKPSYLWMMYRSDWAQKDNMQRILRIWIKRIDWELALKEAILTTPEAHVYNDAKKWRKQLDKARVRVQWDPERDIQNKHLSFKSIQVGIMPSLAETYAKKWIAKIEDVTPLTQHIRSLVVAQQFEQATQLLPKEQAYPVEAELKRILGIG